MEIKPETLDSHVAESGPTETQSTGASYRVNEEGLFLQNGDEERRLCSPLKVVAFTRDQDGESWGRLVKLQDPDGNNKEIAIPMRRTRTYSLLSAWISDGLVPLYASFRARGLKTA